MIEKNIPNDKTTVEYASIEKIVSGGQTGVDRAALNMAIKLNIPHGEWCPKGRLAEDGKISQKYMLKETYTSEYSERTKLNIRDSDGTLILIFETLEKITDGTILTAQEVKEKKKPYLIISLSENSNFVKIASWLADNNIRTLNIAGPRESQSLGIYGATTQFLEGLFLFLQNNRAERKVSLAKF